MRLLVTTDSAVRPRRGGRGRAVLGLAVLGLVATPAAAAEPAKAEAQRERTISIPSQSKKPVVIYGVPGIPLQLLFDAPLGRGAFKIPGVTAHPVLADALILTPSKALARRHSIPLSIPLTTGVVALTLVFRPEAPDELVHISRPEDASLANRSAPPKAKFEVLASKPMERSGTECRLHVLVKMPEAPEGVPVEIRSSAKAFCEASFP